MVPFRGMLGLVFYHINDKLLFHNLIYLCLGTLRHGYGIWLPVSSSRTGVGTPYLGWSSRFFAWSGTS
jgi:hypothetical protein